MEAEILRKAVAGSFGVSRPDEVAAVRHAVTQGWLDAIISVASSDSPMDGPSIALVLGITPEGLTRLAVLRPRTLPV